MHYKPLGYVIVRDSDNRLFAGYRHPGTKKTGFPIWVSMLDNMNMDGGKASIYATAKEAVEISRSIILRDGEKCTVRPVILDA